MERITIKDIEPLVPFSRGSTEIFLTGHWSSKKPFWAEKSSPCRQACPIGNDIARALAFANRGEIDKALDIWRQENPFPGVCGRVCYYPCEVNCNRKDMDQAVNIRGLERFLGDNGRVQTMDAHPDKREKVAVVGSGPAGLSAAYHLARFGYEATVFEALPQPGGMLMYGIPEYRLPKAVLRQEIEHIRNMGVEIRTGVRIGKDISVADIRQEYQAVFLAIGAHNGMTLGIDGDGIAGILNGTTFLRIVNCGAKPDIGQRVAVIGGGNTAIDCARVARRLGKNDVRLIYRRSRAEMPALTEDIEALEAEGIALDLLAAPQRVISKDDRLSAIECIRMELGAPDASGRRRPVPIQGSEYIVSVDTVIAAVGQVPETDFLKDLGVRVTKAGVIEVSPETMMAAPEGVFAGGDSAGANAFVADAIASGKMGALAISCYFEGKDLSKELEACRIGSGSAFSFQSTTDDGRPIDLKSIVTSDELNTICVPYGARRSNLSQTTLQEGALTFAEVVSGLDEISMEAEASRCLSCGTCTECDLCFLICPDISVVKGMDNGYSAKFDYCKGCGVCATTCPHHVIDMGGGK